MANTPKDLALLLVGKKNPDMKAKMDADNMDSAPDMDMDMDKDSPMDPELVNCANDVMMAVKMGSAEKLAHALMDFFQEVDSQPHKEGPDTSDSEEASPEPEEMPEGE